MKKIDANYLDRTRVFNETMANIQNRMSVFKNMYKEEMYHPDPKVDYEVAGRPWFVVGESDQGHPIYNVGTYDISDTRLNVMFFVHHDVKNNKISKIEAEVE
jgi:hypothetical protein